MEITNEAVEPAGAIFGHVSVGTSAVQVSSSTVRLKKGLTLRCPGASDPVANTACVYFGFSSAVTANTNASTGGQAITPGSSVTIPVDNASAVYVISASGTQDVSFVGI
jgi:hypothetical protein